MTTLDGKVALVAGRRGPPFEAVYWLTRPRNHRIVETAFRPMTELSWG